MPETNFTDVTGALDVLQNDKFLALRDPDGTPVARNLNVTGQVCLETANGKRTFYNPSADTNAARGAALNSAIDAAISGDTIYVGIGTYSHTAAYTVDVPCAIIGASMTGVVLSRAGNVCSITADDCQIMNLTVEGTVYADTGDRLRMVDVIVDANTEDYGIRLTDECNDFYFTRLDVSNATLDGLYQDDGTMGHISDSRFHDNGQDGVYMFDTGAAGSNDAVYRPPLISECFFDRNDRHGLNLEGVHDYRVSGCNAEKNGYAGYLLDGVIDCGVSNCGAERNNQSASAETEKQGGFVVVLSEIDSLQGTDTYGNITITGCTTNVEHAGLKIIGEVDTPYKVHIVGNSFHIKGAASGTGVYRGIYGFDLEPEHFINISDNMVHTEDSFSNGRGIELVMESSTDGKRVNVSNNYVGNSDRGYQLVNFSEIHLRGNKAVDCDIAFRSSDSALYVHDADVENCSTVYNTFGSGTVEYFSMVQGKTGTLTDGASIDWNAINAKVATVTLGGNRTLNAPSNLQNGEEYTLIVKQDGTGSRTLSWNSVFNFAGGSAPTLSVGANAVDVFKFVSDGTDLFEVSSKIGQA